MDVAFLILSHFSLSYFNCSPLKNQCLGIPVPRNMVFVLSWEEKLEEGACTFLFWALVWEQGNLFFSLFPLSIQLPGDGLPRDRVPQSLVCGLLLLGIRQRLPLWDQRCHIFCRKGGTFQGTWEVAVTGTVFFQWKLDLIMAPNLVLETWFCSVPSLLVHSRPLHLYEFSPFSHLLPFFCCVGTQDDS